MSVQRNSIIDCLEFILFQNKIDERFTNEIEYICIVSHFIPRYDEMASFFENFVSPESRATMNTLYNGFTATRSTLSRGTETTKGARLNIFGKGKSRLWSKVDDSERHK